MSRKLLPLDVQAEALYWLTKRTATIDEVSQLCGASKTALRNWQRAVIHGECFSDGGIGPDRAAQLQEAYNECLVRHGRKREELPEPLLRDRETYRGSTDTQEPTSPQATLWQQALRDGNTHLVDELQEIAENIQGKDLTALEQGEVIARCKVIYETLHPQAALWHEASAPEPSSLREVLSLRRIDALATRVGSVERRLDALEATTHAGD